MSFYYNHRTRLHFLTIRYYICRSGSWEKASSGKTAAWGNIDKFLRCSHAHASWMRARNEETTKDRMQRYHLPLVRRPVKRQKTLVSPRDFIVRSCVTSLAEGRQEIGVTAASRTFVRNRTPRRRVQPFYPLVHPYLA